MSIISKIFGNTSGQEIEVELTDKETEIVYDKRYTTQSTSFEDLVQDAARYALAECLFSTLPDQTKTERVKVDLSKLQRQASKNKGDALYLLSRLYDQGQGVEKNSQMARDYLNRAAAAGNSAAMNALGLHYLDGENPNGNIDKAIDLFDRSLKGGCAPAATNLAMAYMIKGGDENRERAFHLLLKRAHDNNLPELFMLIIEFSHRNEDFGQQCAKHLVHYAIDSKNVSLLMLASEALRVKAVGLLKEWSAIVYLNVMAASLGSQPAKQMISSLDQNRIGEIENELGERFASMQDYPTALRLFASAAEKGNAEAYVGLGCFTENAPGVVRGNRKPVDYFTQAHQMGSYNGTFCLAGCYANGEGGVSKDMAKAFELFKLSAEHGVPKAQYNMALIYLNGFGVVTPDGDKALEWMLKAAQAGSPEATAYLNQLSRLQRSGYY